MRPPIVLVHSDVPITYTDNEHPSWMLPDGNRCDASVSSDNTSRSNIFLWFDVGVIPMSALASLQHRVFAFEQPNGEWQPLADSRKVHRRTIDDPDPISDEDPQFGAKFKLSVGRYSFEFRIVLQDQPFELRGGSFRVFRSKQASLEHCKAHIQSLYKQDAKA